MQQLLVLRIQGGGKSGLHQPNSTNIITIRKKQSSDFGTHAHTVNGDNMID